MEFMEQNNAIGSPFFFLIQENVGIIISILYTSMLCTASCLFYIITKKIYQNLWEVIVDVLLTILPG